MTQKTMVTLTAIVATFVWFYLLLTVHNKAELDATHRLHFKTYLGYLLRT